ncbi:MAG: LacI family transcriptional regulator [Oscillospiraceae bacterium]|jgi:LacI family transcriptional regulator|nr:LacI family transcriptional regulator [Oscillospiraceae bacterium]
MTTLKDIALEAGVSATTVSNVINNKWQRVSPETVEKIKNIISRKNYIPNMTARTLAKNSSPIIGIINHLITRKSGGFMADPFHNTFMGSIEDRIRNKGFFLMVRTVEDSRGLEEVFRNWNLAGMIFTGLFQDAFFDDVRKMQIPYVLIDSYIDSPEVCNVGLEDQKGGYMATRYLLERGHRVIAFTSPYVRRDGVVEKRLLGYMQALSEFGVPFNPELIFEQEISISEGVRLGYRLSENRNITGIFSTADILAAGIMAGLRKKGVRIPEDKSIIGFDDNYLCQITYPRLTTIHQDAEEKGIVAIELMIAQLMNKPIRERKIILPVRLVERESVRSL